jgi:polysaccharide pyruvyl transferase CsaB
LQRAVLIGYYGRGNLGDELMLVCLNQWLKAQDIQVTVLADDAENVTRQHHLPAVQNYPLLGQYGWVDALLRGKAWRTIRALVHCDVVLCGGGDVIRDAIGWRTFTFQVEKLVVSLLLRKPVYLINVGLTRPVTRYGRALLKWLLPRCRGIVVRDARSVDICREYGVTRRVRLAPDIVRRLPDLFPQTAGRRDVDKTSVLVALHGDSNVYGKYHLSDNRLQTLAGLLDAIVEEHNLDIEFFPFQPEQDGGDARIAHRVQTLMRHAGRTRILDWTIDVAEIAERVSRSRLVIAMRLHAAVLAATYAVPCVLMPYDQKVVEFGKQAQIPYTLMPEMLDEPAAAARLLESAFTDLIPPPPLEPDGDWLRMTLASLNA